MAFGDDFREWFWKFFRGSITTSEYVAQHQAGNDAEFFQRYGSTYGQQGSYSPIQTPQQTINQIAGYEVDLDMAEKGAEMLLEASIDMNLFLLNIATLPVGTAGSALCIGASLLAWQKTGNVKYRNAAILQALFVFLQLSGAFDKVGEGLEFVFDKLGFKEFLKSLGIVADDALIEMAETEAKVLFEELGEAGFKDYMSKYGVQIAQDITGDAMLGQDWYSYFVSKYGVNNVNWKANSYDDLIQNPQKIYGMTENQVGDLLGPNWQNGPYGTQGQGWKYTSDQGMFYYHPGGGYHTGSYYGISSGNHTYPVGSQKVTGFDTGYVPSIDDKSTLFIINEDGSITYLYGPNK